MINVTNKKSPAPEQAPELRINNWDEVSGGYDELTAVREAMRCLKCRTKPCMNSGCPAKLNIPAFIDKVSKGDYEAAYEIITERSNLSPICSRVCPQENQCEGACSCGVKGQPVAIGKIERFVSDWHFAHACGCNAKKEIPADAKKVCIVGAGPAGLSCAKDLAKAGYAVTVYDSFKKVGGVMSYGIPGFRLSKDIVEREAQILKDMGVKFVTGKTVGKKNSLEKLMIKEGYSAAFIGIGAAVASGMGIPGEDLEGVCSAQEYLMQANLLKAYGEKADKPYFHAQKVVVVGGGNVAMDASRVAKRFGADVTIVYRRSLAESPAAKAEIEEAMAEGINFKFLNNPVKIHGTKAGQVKSVECIKMELGEPDESGRRSPVPVEGSEFKIPVDCVIMAIGNKVNKADVESFAVKSNKNGTIIVNASGEALKGVYAGGDVVTGPQTVVKAMRAGKEAAAAIIKKLK